MKKIQFSKLSKEKRFEVFAGFGLFLIAMVVALSFYTFSQVVPNMAEVKQEIIAKQPQQLPPESTGNTEAFPKEEIITTYSNRSAKYPSHPLYVEVNENKCLALNIYYESRNQSVKGQYAVAFVTLNRLQLAAFPDNVCDVVYQKSWNKNKRRFIAQFSWTTCERCIKPGDKKRWKLANTIAKNAMKFYGTNMLDDPTFGATHYHATYVKPRWRLRFKKTIKIESHIFYKMDNIEDSVAYFIKQSKK